MQSQYEKLSVASVPSEQLLEILGVCTKDGRFVYNEEVVTATFTHNKPKDPSR